MRKRLTVFGAIFLLWAPVNSKAETGSVCQNYGPQAPRDIGSKHGRNPRKFPYAPAASSMNLCNIHFHIGAEHKGPNFFKMVASNEAAGRAKLGGGTGFQCNATTSLTKTELRVPPKPVCNGLKSGETIEVHWVYSSCAVGPGHGLAACSSASCTNPTLRVESQVFLVVNDPTALDFRKFDYSGRVQKSGLHLAKTLPAQSGTPVLFRGSTTGPGFTQQQCSPLQATWSVRPNCARVDINSLGAWCTANVFGENHGHGVRPLVTAPALLDKIR